MKLSIVIPTWNGMPLLRRCLDSLRRQTWREFEVVVSDDGSIDGTAAQLADDYPEVLVARSARNSGFAVAVNRGITRARGEWIFLLNNDVILADDCLEHLMAQAESGECAMLTPLVLWTEDPRLVYSAGDAIGRNGRPEGIGYRVAREALSIHPHPFGVSGGYGLFKRAMLEQIGVLDTAFGAYFEDSDLCFRARWAGCHAAVVPAAIAWHVGSATIRGRLWWRTRQCYRNHALLVIKNFSPSMLWWNAGALVRERAHQTGRVFGAARAEWGAVCALGYTIHAWLGLAARIPGALLKRRRIMASRRLTSTEMQALLAPGGRNE